MHIIKTTFLSLTLALLSSQANAIKLKEALATAYNNNPVLKAEQKTLESVNENKPQSITSFLPQISISIDRGEQEVDRETTGTTENLIDNKSIDLVQPLFRGGRNFAQLKQSENIIKQSRNELLQIEQEVLLDAVEVYMNLVRRVEELNLNKNNVLVFEKQLEVTEERFNLGEVTKTDVAQAQASLAEALSAKIVAQGNLEAAYAEYESVINAKPQGASMPEEKVMLSSDLEELTSTALENHPSIKTILYEIEAAKNNISIEKSFLLPSVDLVASKGESNTAFFNGSTSDFESESVFVNLSVPLFNANGRTSEYSRIRQAKKDVDRLKYNLENRKNTVKNSVISAYQALNVSRNSIRSNQHVVNAQKVVLEGTEQEAKIGARTTLDVLEAEQTLFEAEEELISTKVDEIINSYALLSAIGQLNAQNLELDVDMYNPEQHYKEVGKKIIGF